MSRTYSKAKGMEVELRMFWDIVAAVSELRADDPRNPIIVELIQEAETIAQHTDWDALRIHIEKWVASNPKRKSRLVAVCASSA